MVLAAGTSAGWDRGMWEQRIFSNHQRLILMTATGILPWSGTLTRLFHHPAVANACHVPCTPPGAVAAAAGDTGGVSEVHGNTVSHKSVQQGQSVPNMWPAVRARWLWEWGPYRARIALLREHWPPSSAVRPLGLGHGHGREEDRLWQLRGAWLGQNVYTSGYLALQLEPIKCRHCSCAWNTASSSSWCAEGVVRSLWPEREVQRHGAGAARPGLEDLLHLCDHTCPLRTVLMIAIQLITCMEYVHTKSPVCHNVKPEDFLVRQPGSKRSTPSTSAALAWPRSTGPRDQEAQPSREHKSLKGTALLEHQYTPSKEQSALTTWRR
ncbi:hypothetical protein QTO34_001748 [Cnephaeus nilssonii]|uniref:Uncharacterized protein n=1 Tax=Cnephaeus nilssonii TaxID=3371016 RepID=A0AA40LKQ9_CNENI|nr:hypothetical protein QTO34_001748 [Eptesicus nilssonii]